MEGFGELVAVVPLLGPVADPHALVAMEGRPWAEFGKARKPITKNRLAALLGGFHVVPDSASRGRFQRSENRILGRCDIDPTDWDVR